MKKNFKINPIYEDYAGFTYSDIHCEHCNAKVSYHDSCNGQGRYNGCINCHPENFMPGLAEDNPSVKWVENCRWCKE